MPQPINLQRLANEIVAYNKAINQVLCDAFGVDDVTQISLRFVDHIPHAPVVIPLMRVVGGPWAALLDVIETFTAEQRGKKVGAGAGVQLDEEGKKAVQRAQPAG